MTIDHKCVFAFYSKALDSVNPGVALKQVLLRDNNLLTIIPPDGSKKTVNLDEVENIYVVGCGKATALMAESVEEILGPHVTTGVICVKYGHLPSKALEKIELIEAGHPEPDENGVTAASQALALLEKAQERDLVIALISGGGSALWPLPVDGVTLYEKVATTRAMLESGATISETNCIRKRLSKIKGGHAAIAAYPAQTVVCMISDVENDDPSVIASGPFTKAPDNPEDVREILAKYKLSCRLPERVYQFLLKPEHTPGFEKKHADFSHVTSCICGNNTIALEKASQEAMKAGYVVTNLGSIHFGDAKKSAVEFVDRVKNLYLSNPNDKQCIIAGGETTVVLGRKYGKGGRNQELALAAGIELNNAFKDFPCTVTILSCGTDGTDGPTDAAGAIVDTEMVDQAVKAGLDPQKALADHNAYPFFETLGALVKTGPTNTNVMDIQIAIITT